jgi:RHS repeat-associated protein
VDGRQIAQDADGTITTFTWDWATGVLELLSDGDKRYLVGHDTLGWEDGAGSWTYAVPDALGSVRQAVDATAAVVAAREWTPYGVEVGGDHAGLGYTGEWWDAAVGLQYLRARWYDSYLNHFTSPDTIAPDYRYPPSAHNYLYAFANPINHLDPSGHSPVSYNGQVAAAYALDHWRTGAFNDEYVNFDDSGGDCTNFVSQALWAGGLRDHRSLDEAAGTEISYWHEDVARKETYDPDKDDTWVWTPSLHDFLTEVLHLASITYGVRYGDRAVPHVNEQNDPDALDTDWISFLTQRGAMIKPGDVVFYWQEASDVNWAEWTHAAIVVGWGLQTYFPDGNPVPVSSAHPPLISWGCIGTQKPLVVEHSTGFAKNDQLPRSIDNTGSPVEDISIVQVSRPAWSFLHPWLGSW